VERAADGQVALQLHGGEVPRDEEADEVEAGEDQPGVDVPDALGESHAAMMPEVAGRCTRGCARERARGAPHRTVTTILGAVADAFAVPLPVTIATAHLPGIQKRRAYVTSPVDGVRFTTVE